MAIMKEVEIPQRLELLARTHSGFFQDLCEKDGFPYFGDSMEI